MLQVLSYVSKETLWNYIECCTFKENIHRKLADLFMRVHAWTKGLSPSLFSILPIVPDSLVLDM